MHAAGFVGKIQVPKVVHQYGRAANLSLCFEKLSASFQYVGALENHCCPRFDMKLGKDPAQVGGDGPFANMKAVGNFLVYQTFSHQANDL